MNELHNWALEFLGWKLHENINWYPPGLPPTANILGHRKPPFDWNLAGQVIEKIQESDESPPLTYCKFQGYLTLAWPMSPETIIAAAKEATE